MKKIGEYRGKHKLHLFCIKSALIRQRRKVCKLSLVFLVDLRSQKLVKIPRFIQYMSKISREDVENPGFENLYL